ncbi:glutamyl-tRNA reductase [Sulfurimonas sp. MAG313]|nr:glutamyl-tRNA reductase [Sulfurimonas sp. MAG313]MDF1880267.1 glutamyl-tRNA reductase [Sulfurimonas sp. MAG313]
MHYLLISFSHHNTTLEIREKLALNDEESLSKCLSLLTDHNTIYESMIVSTCNRLEVLCSVENVLEATEYIFLVLSSHANIQIQELEGRADILEDQGAMHHLFNVASSLDSMVVGETQIVGQLKDAFKFANDNKFCEQKISRAMHYAFKCAAEVRNKSSISSKPVSIASVAVSKVKSKFSTIKDKTALIIGAGEMSRLCAKHLTSAGCKCTIMNRTFSKAQKIADECGENVSVKPFDTLAQSINEFDFIFTATGASESIIKSDMLKACSFERHWFDMAIPRDIDDSSISGLHIYRIDDLKNIVSENIALREDEAKLCYSIVGKYTQEFFNWLQSLSIEPFIKEVYIKAMKCADEETTRAIKSGYIPKEYEKQALKMNEQVLKRFLHDVTKRMREASHDLDADTLMSSMQYICELNDNNKG